ncbi:hypothetical protein Q9L42_011255 [Methylomarinum sp. Ch1-1]|uniref:Uncharacterized protein n=1 Tax=Methylomarinum roseum TaxID=3067653 RepID=A0AAU7NPQ9_9GAMM|nr:hypothetical protein [Methylomarinum sp. Ch1-1]MDP4521125.1 hypothetical protein [Methylomarinum sp. Ch1-1]
MPTYHSILIHHHTKADRPTQYEFLRTNRVIYHPCELSEDKEIENLVYRVVQKPKNLLLHMQRIFACYRQRRSEQLYAALADLLTLLSGGGKNLAYRVIKGTARGMDREQLANLQRYFQGGHRLPGNGFSILTEGQVGDPQIIEKTAAVTIEHDYLALAHDYIEYSQLDEAMDVLEQGVNEAPFREDLQEQLLELYRLTDNQARFKSMYASVSQSRHDMIPAWNSLEHYFNGRK